MFSSTNQYANASKAFFESQLDAFNALTGIVMDGTGKIASLNMATARSSADDAIATTKEMLAAKDQTVFLSLATELAKPNTEKMAAYGRELGSIVSTINSAYGKAAEAQVAQVQGNVSELVDKASDKMVDAVKKETTK